MKITLVLCLAAVSAAQNSEPGSISGAVRDAATGEPVPRAAVSLHLPNGGVAGSQADEQGQYVFDGLAAGSYRVGVAAPLETGQTLTAQQEKTVALEAGQKVTTVDFLLQAMGVISGRVLDDNKDPVAGVTVVLVAKRYDHGALRYPLAAARTQTDAMGGYRLSGIPSGDAYLVETQNQLLQKASEGGTPADTFYPNALSPDLAEEIVLNSGEMRSGVDVQQKKLPAYCVDGAVQGGPEAALALEILDAGAAGGSRSAQPAAAGKSKPDGTFQVCGLHPGQYAFNATGVSPGAGQPPFFAVASVEVKDSDVHDFRLPHASASPVPAEFVWASDASKEDPNPSVTILLQSRRMNVQFQIAYAAGTAKTLQLQPDEYTIDARGMSRGWYVKDITCGGRNVLHATAKLGGDESCGGLQITMARDAGSLAARVADRDGNPIAGVNVIVIPESAGTEAEMSAAMTFGPTGKDGVYTARALPPGKYRVLATTESINFASNHVDKVWMAQARAQEVEIGASANVQVKVEPQPLQ
jgi:protocatechuate 3,4-dioxygenase beta subunit